MEGDVDVVAKLRIEKLLPMLLKLPNRLYDGDGTEDRRPKVPLTEQKGLEWGERAACNTQDNACVCCCLEVCVVLEAHVSLVSSASCRGA